MLRESWTQLYVHRKHFRKHEYAKGAALYILTCSLTDWAQDNSRSATGAHMRAYIESVTVRACLDVAQVKFREREGTFK